MCLPPSLHVVQQLKCLIKENCSRTQTTFRCMHAGVNVGSWNQPWIVSKKTVFNFHQLPDRLFKSIHLSTRSESSIPLLQLFIFLLLCFLVTIQKQGFETQKAFCKGRHHASGISVAVYIYIYIHQLSENTDSCPRRKKITVPKEGNKTSPSPKFYQKEVSTYDMHQTYERIVRLANNTFKVASCSQLFCNTIPFRLPFFIEHCTHTHVCCRLPQKTLNSSSQNQHQPWDSFISIMTKSLQNHKGGRKTFFFIIMMGQDSDKQNSTILIHRVWMR